MMVHSLPINHKIVGSIITCGHPVTELKSIFALSSTRYVVNYGFVYTFMRLISTRDFYVENANFSWLKPYNNVCVVL